MFQKLVKENKVFFYLYLLFLLILGVILYIFPKNELHLYLNQYHAPFFDSFFRMITFGGDGLTPFLVGIVFLFISYKKALFVSLVPSIAGLVSQFFKRVVFPDVLRPKGVFGDVGELYLIPGFDAHTMHSFPSGHTTTIFSLAFCLVFMSKKTEWKLVWFFIALLVGYSRVYLSQHFLIDVYFGSLLGVICALLLLNLYPLIKSDKFNKSLLIVFSKK